MQRIRLVRLGIKDSSTQRLRLIKSAGAAVLLGENERIDMRQETHSGFSFHLALPLPAFPHRAPLRMTGHTQK